MKISVDPAIENKRIVFIAFRLIQKIMKIKKLLFVTKFEQLGLDALQSLMDIRDAGLNHVVFLNVIERERVAMRRGTGYQKDEEIRLRERANIRFID